MKNKTFTVSEVFHTEDGEGYNLNDREICYEGKKGGDYFQEEKKAFFQAGANAGCGGSLTLIEDGFTGNLTFVHRHGCTGEVTILSGVDSLKRHLAKIGMELKGRMPR